ncbi:MAG: hypothetical protein HPY85_02780 [Anaerolineae bacterium]|nr:hypothetical protein [Anaerolineae bacterium]
MNPTTIAYFISPHGFGHAARAAAVMQASQSLRDDLHFDLYTSVPAWFFEQSGITWFRWIDTRTDIGLLQSTPFTEDIPATLTALHQFYPVPDALLDLLAAKLVENRTALVICDIAPSGILAAQKAGIPSVLVENFTWDWIYQAYEADYPAFAELIAHLAADFQQADVRIQSEPLCSPVENAHFVPYPIARRAFTPRAITRARLGIEAEETVVLLSMGGIAEDFQTLDQLHAFPHTAFLIPGGSDRLLHAGNCIFLPHYSEFYHPDLINAADFVIGKAGYSTIAEVVQAGIPFAFISRERFREASVLSRYIRQHIPSIEITESEYRAGRWTERVPELLALSPSCIVHTNGAEQAAEIVLGMLK